MAEKPQWKASTDQASIVQTQGGLTGTTWPGQTTVQQWPYGYWYGYPSYTDTSGHVQRFRGPVKSLSRLPGSKYQTRGGHAQVGDAYYVEDMKVLVIRTARGWLYVDDE